MWNVPQEAAAADTEAFGLWMDGPPPLPGADPEGPVADPSPPPAVPPTPAAWSAGQLNRMADEWRRLQRAFAYHPHVTVTPTDGGGGRDGQPPAAYRVDYRVQTLIVEPESQQLAYAAAATMEVLLPADFPAEPPVVRPLTPVFHPNVSYDDVSLDGLWHVDETLVGLVRKVGEVLAYRTYDAGYAVNPAAVDWLAANHAHTPTDAAANLAPTAGGDPLGRIRTYGPQSLDSLKQSVLATQAALLASGNAPDAAAVAAFADQTRQALGLFLEPDVPEALRGRAEELDRAAGELVDMLPTYAFVRGRRRRTVGLRQAYKLLSATVKPLSVELHRLAALADASGVDDAMAALRLIPDAATLQPVQLALPKLAAEAGRLVAALAAERQALDAMIAPPPTGTAPPTGTVPPTTGEPFPGGESLLGKRLAHELSVGAAEAEVAKREAADALASVEPGVRHAVAEADALDVAARWREYLDLAAQARAMERLVRQLGAEGLQAYFIQNAAGRFGPYQFEQPVDLGGGDLIVRSFGGRALEVWDVAGDRPLGGSEVGSVVIALPAAADAPPPADEGAAPPARFPTRFAATERCDDLMVRLEFLRRSAIETLQRFATYAGPAKLWPGHVCRVLARPDVRKALEAELAGAARRWRHTIIDLAALAPWKERLATYFLAHRCAAEVPVLVAGITTAKQQHHASKKRLDQIMAKADRDHDTGALVLPPSHAKQYAEEIALQERTAMAAQAQAARLKSLVQQLIPRLQDPKLLGKGVTPQLRVVPPLGEALAALDLSDAAIAELVGPMEQLLGTSLGGPASNAGGGEGLDAAGGPEVAPAFADAIAGGTTGRRADVDAVDSDAYGVDAYAEVGDVYASGPAGEPYQAAHATTPYGSDNGSTDPSRTSALAEQVSSANGGGHADAVAVNRATAASAVRHDRPASEHGRFAHVSVSATEPDRLPGADHPGQQGVGPRGDEGWVIVDDVDEAAGDPESTDLVFGFEPDPTPPATHSPPGR